MIELLRTRDPVLLGLLRARLREKGIEVFVFDDHTSSLYAGALDAVAARVMVSEADEESCRDILSEIARLDGGPDLGSGSS